MQCQDKGPVKFQIESDRHAKLPYLPAIRLLRRKGRSPNFDIPKKKKKKNKKKRTKQNNLNFLIEHYQYFFFKTDTGTKFINILKNF